MVPSSACLLKVPAAAVRLPAVTLHIAPPHPPVGDSWLVGGASNTGGAVLKQFFSSEQLQQLSSRIDTSQPCGLDYYPINKPGERFPVNDPQLQPRLDPRPADDAQFLQGGLGLYLQWRRLHGRVAVCGRTISPAGLDASGLPAAHIAKRLACISSCLLCPACTGMLEGMSRIEADAYGLLAQLGATPVTRVLTAGGGAVNDKWTALRAAAIGVPVAAAQQGMCYCGGGGVGVVVVAMGLLACWARA